MEIPRLPSQNLWVVTSQTRRIDAYYSQHINQCEGACRMNHEVTVTSEIYLFPKGES